MKGSMFKHSTQLFEMNHLLYTAQLQKSLIEGTYTPSEGNKFTINERGKTRYITSNTMPDKAVKHILSDEILTPALSKYLIYDNGASQKNKGVSFHRKRFEAHLHKYFIKHGNNNGYILLGDFSGYYANIPHDKCFKVLEYFLRRVVGGQNELKIILLMLKQIFATFRIDVSRFSSAAIANLKICPIRTFTLLAVSS